MKFIKIPHQIPGELVVKLYNIKVGSEFLTAVAADDKERANTPKDA